MPGAPPLAGNCSRAEVPGLKLHLDFGQANFGRDGYDVFYKELGGHIRHVHFSDNRSKADDHMPVGLGAVNCKRAVQSLKVAGYDGAITLENLCNDPVVQYGYLDMSRKMVAEPWGKD